MKLLWTIALALTLAGCGKKEQAGAPVPEQVVSDEKHASEHIEEANVVELSLAAQRRAGVVVENVRSTRVEAVIQATGSVQPVDSKIVHLRPLARGRVLEVLAKIGDRVGKDQVLARYDNIEGGELSSQIEGARAETQRIRIQLANARRQAERQKSLLEIGAVPAKDFEAADTEAKGIEETLRTQQAVVAGLEVRLRRFGSPSAADHSISTIRAPFSGVIIRTEAAPGDVIDSASTLFSIADLARVYVEAQVYEKDLGKIRLNQPAVIRVDTYPGESFQGRIVAIKDILDPRTRTATVRCELPNPDGKLRLEMFANLAIPTFDSHQALSLPGEAVTTINRRQVVFVRKAELHFEARVVEVLGDGERREIAAGLKAGEPVVVKGAFQLKSAFLAKELESEHEHD